MTHVMRTKKGKNELPKTPVLTEKTRFIYLSGTVTLYESRLLSEAEEIESFENAYSHPFQVNSGLCDQEFISLNEKYSVSQISEVQSFSLYPFPFNQTKPRCTS